MRFLLLERVAAHHRHQHGDTASGGLRRRHGQGPRGRPGPTWTRSCTGRPAPAPGRSGSPAATLTARTTIRPTLPGVRSSAWGCRTSAGCSRTSGPASGMIGDRRRCTVRSAW